MVAEDLFELDEARPVLLQPRGEPLVKLCARRLGERVVRRVADQQVTEAEAVLPGNLRPVRTDELAPDERGEPRRHLRLVGRECLHGPSVEDLAFHGAALEHAPLGSVELVESSREQRLESRRHSDLIATIARHRHHLDDEERIAAGGVGDPVAKLCR